MTYFNIFMDIFFPKYTFCAPLFLALVIYTARIMFAIDSIDKKVRNIIKDLIIKNGDNL